MLSVLIIHLPKLRTCGLIRGYEAFTEKNFTHVFLFLIYDVYVKSLSSLIQQNYVCILKIFKAFS